MFDSSALDIEPMDNSENGKAPGTNTVSLTHNHPMYTPDQHLGSSAGPDFGDGTRIVAIDPAADFRFL
eukprot:10149780-Karenia_brevis.AAC.1